MTTMYLIWSVKKQKKNSSNKFYFNQGKKQWDMLKNDIVSTKFEVKQGDGMGVILFEKSS